MDKALLPSESEPPNYFRTPQFFSQVEGVLPHAPPQPPPLEAKLLHVLSCDQILNSEHIRRRKRKEEEQKEEENDLEELRRNDYQLVRVVNN